MRFLILCSCLFIYCVNSMAEEVLISDQRLTDQLETRLGNRWRLVTDSVMGGVSDGYLSVDTVKGKRCLRLGGSVSLENRGGFLQAALDIQDTIVSDATGFLGLAIEVFGNDHDYNLHLRTRDLWLPWQSYRASFHAPARWQSLKLPFEAFSGYRIEKKLDLKHLNRIGLLAIGREFFADLCLAKLTLYRD